METSIIKRIVNLGREHWAPDAIHIAVGMDRNFARPMGVLLTSILEHNENVAFHIFSDGIDECDVNRIRATASQYGIFCAWYAIDVSSFTALPTTYALTTAAYFRFAAGEYFYRKEPRFLYLDSDIICIGDLRPLFAMDMQGKPIAAVEDSERRPPGWMESIGHTGDGYFNSGVLLIDTNRWHEERIYDRAIALLRDDPERYKLPDQDVLNVLYANKVLWLDEKYNHRSNMRNEYPKETVLVHYIFKPKPWFAWYVCTGKSLWGGYSDISEWRDVPPSQPRIATEYRLLSYFFFRRGEFLKGVAWYAKYLRRKLFG